MHPYHIHVDGTVVPQELYRDFLAMGFRENNFIGHPPVYAHFDPLVHMTIKPADHAAFLRVWDRAEELAERYPDFTGYLEGEFIAFDDSLTEKSYVPGVPVPFYIMKRRRLRGLQCREDFREGEIHLTLDKDASDPRLIESLLQAGLYGAYMQKRDHIALVLTIQGARRKEIIRIAEAVRHYVERVGGAVRASLKEEVAIKHRFFGGIRHELLPEVIDEIEYFE